MKEIRRHRLATSGAEGAADGADITVDLDLGQLERLVFTAGGRSVAPFHRVPWADDPAGLAPGADFSAAPHLARMAGDFFCAPFGRNDIEPAPSHGWPGNASWTLVADEAFSGGRSVTLRLNRTICGATLSKRLTVRDGHPFLYQAHIFSGGSGSLPVATHAMLSLPHGALLSTSPKRIALSPAGGMEHDPERGRSILAYPGEADDPGRFPLADGGRVDLLTYPLDDGGHEDFALLIESAGSRFGWTAAVRPSEGDLALSLKNPADFPVTMFWYSNGGRKYAPWSSRHRHVLGIEEGRTLFGDGHRASTQPNRLTDEGVATALDLDPEGHVEVRHVIGAVPVPQGFARVRTVAVSDDRLAATDEAGLSVACPFDAGFLAYC